MICTLFGVLCYTDYAVVRLHKPINFPERCLPTFQGVLLQKENIMSFPIVDRFWNKVQINEPDECWEWKGSKVKDGYGSFRIDIDSIHVVGAHRVSWFLCKGIIPDGLCVCHHCDNPGCVNPDHLFLGTRQDNENDKISKNRHARGEGIPSSKLTTSQVISIRDKYNQGVRQIDLANQYNVSTANISLIVNNNGWKDVTPINSGAVETR